MTTYYVGGASLINRFSNLEAAIERAEDGDIIELHKDAIGVTIPVKHNITLNGNGHLITAAADSIALYCSSFVTLDNILFECSPKTNAVRLNHGGHLTRITTRTKGPTAFLYPTVLHYGGTLTIEDCDIMRIDALSPKEPNDFIATEIRRSVIRDYYNGNALLNDNSNLSLFGGKTTVSGSYLMGSSFYGETTFSDTVFGNFNLFHSGHIKLTSCTLATKHLNTECLAGEPEDGPLKDMVSNIMEHAISIWDGNVTIDGYSSKAEPKTAGILMLNGNLLVCNSTVDNAASGHSIRGGSVRFENVNDNTPWLIGENARYFSANSNVVIRSNRRTAMDELHEMIGLGSVKRQLRTLLNTIKVNLQYPEKDYGFSNHMVFAGDPGTGKTTVAKLVAKALYEIGAIPENKCTEVAASQLIKGYVGQTGEHVEAVMQEALGGVIFIDEAYELMVKDGQNSFNNDALAVLLRYMEDHRRDLVVIAAGYEKEMREFLASNIGLTRRFQWVSFEDYTASEMADIFMLMCERLDETFAIDDPHSVLEDCFAQLTGYYLSHPDPKGRVTNGGNGGLARNLFQQVIFARNNRIAETSNTTMQILQSDIQCGLAEEMHKAMSVI